MEPMGRMGRSARPWAGRQQLGCLTSKMAGSYELLVSYRPLAIASFPKRGSHRNFLTGLGSPPSWSATRLRDALHVSILVQLDDDAHVTAVQLPRHRLHPSRARSRDSCIATAFSSATARATRSDRPDAQRGVVPGDETIGVDDQSLAGFQGLPFDGTGSLDERRSHAVDGADPGRSC